MEHDSVKISKVMFVVQRQYLSRLNPDVIQIRPLVQEGLECVLNSSG